MLTKTIKYLDIKMNRYKCNFKSYKRLEKIALYRIDHFSRVIGGFMDGSNN
jgi:hypothetical protein